MMYYTKIKNLYHVYNSSGRLVLKTPDELQAKREIRNKQNEAATIGIGELYRLEQRRRAA